MSVKKQYLFTAIADVTVLLLVIFGKSLSSLAMTYLPECVFLKMGFACPSCGGTRCISLFLSGDMLGSFMMNQFFFIMLLYGIVLMIALNMAVFFKNKLATKLTKLMVHQKTILSLVIALALFTLLRNVLPSLSIK